MNTVSNSLQSINKYAFREGCQTSNMCCNAAGGNSGFSDNAGMSANIQQLLLQVIQQLLSQLSQLSGNSQNFAGNQGQGGSVGTSPSGTTGGTSTVNSQPVIDPSGNAEAPVDANQGAEVNVNNSLNQAVNNAIYFSKNNGPEVTFPLTADQLEGLKETNAVSPTLKTDPRVVLDANDVVPPPTHPGDEGFWDEFEQVVDMQVARREGAMAVSEMTLPAMFSDMSMDEAAEAVHTDFPTKWPTALTEQLLSEGAPMDSDIIPQRTEDDFVNRNVMLSELIGWSVSTVSPTAFSAKWEHGRARPEAVAWAVHNGDLTAPAHIKEKIDAMNLTSAEDFTAYDEGSPIHPSWPAMHSAASQSSLYLAVVFDLSPEQLEECRKLDFAVAQFRSVAGVHYETDNLAGLTIGQEVMAQELPDFLAKFGADPDAVRAKIEQVRHDWYEYDYKKYGEE